MVLLLKPFGWEMPSSYSAGSQRAKGVFEAPSRGLFLEPHRRSSPSETLLEKRWTSVHIMRGARQPRVKSIFSHRLLQRLVMVRYLLMFGRVKHRGGRTRAAQPVISASFSKSSFESRSGKIEQISMESEFAFTASNPCTCLTCGVEGAFVSVMRPLLQQAEGLPHVVCRSHSRACVTARLLQETKGVVRAHHLLAHPSQTPGGRTTERLVKLHFTFLYDAKDQLTQLWNKCKRHPPVSSRHQNSAAGTGC